MSELDDAIRALQGDLCLCCDQPWTDKAHIRPSGMGGQPSMFRADNLVGLCRHCHMVFDGQQKGSVWLMRKLMGWRRELVALRRSLG